MNALTQPPSLPSRDEHHTGGCSTRRLILPYVQAHGGGDGGWVWGGGGATGCCEGGGEMVGGKGRGDGEFSVSGRSGVADSGEDVSRPLRWLNRAIHAVKPAATIRKLDQRMAQHPMQQPLAGSFSGSSCAARERGTTSPSSQLAGSRPAMRT
eukprot:scaffold195170_cov24-Tisochrysis_lutea.AAC.1